MKTYLAILLCGINSCTSNPPLFSGVPLSEAEAEISVAIINKHLAPKKATLRYGLAFPVLEVAKICAFDTLKFKNAVSLASLRKSSAGTYRSGGGNPLHILKFDGLERANKVKELEIYLQDYTSPEGMETWVYKLRLMGGHWRVVERRLLMIA